MDGEGLTEPIDRTHRASIRSIAAINAYVRRLQNEARQWNPSPMPPREGARK